MTSERCPNCKTRNPLNKKRCRACDYDLLLFRAQAIADMQKRKQEITDEKEKAWKRAEKTMAEYYIRVKTRARG